MTKYVTVVFAIEDENAFSTKRKEIMKSLEDFDVDTPPPFGVCAFSIVDEIKRLEMIESALEEDNDVDLALSVISMVELPEHYPMVNMDK